MSTPTGKYDVPLVRDLGALAGRRVFCRFDFNVPLDEAGHVTDTTRLRAALPTLQYITEQGARLICASHLGRPKGKIVDRLRMNRVGDILQTLLNEKLSTPRTVRVADDVVGPHAQQLVEQMENGDIVLLQNVRFEAGETKNELELCKAFAHLADIYVNDAFGTAHRAHASTAGMAQFVSQRAAGFLMHREISVLRQLLSDTERPFVAILGGAKVSDKMGVLENLVSRVDTLIIGGAMANTFLLAEGLHVGKSLAEPELVSLAQSIASGARQRGCTLLIPQDAVTATSLDTDDGHVTGCHEVGSEQMILDIGPSSVERFGKALLNAKTIFWNGPMGVFEKPPFARGTMAMAKSVAAANAFSVVGGGDSVSAIHQSGVADQISHISTGGGASLEFIEGKILPGISALQQLEN